MVDEQRLCRALVSKAFVGDDPEGTSRERPGWLKKGLGKVGVSYEGGESQILNAFLGERLRKTGLAGGALGKGCG